MTIRSFVVVGLALLVAAPPALGATRRVSVPLPKPGQITLAGLFVKATPRAGTPVSTFRPPPPTLRLVNRAALAKDLVVVTGVVRVPRTRARFALVVAVVRRAAPGAASRGLLQEPTNLIVSYTSPSVAGFTVSGQRFVLDGVRPGDCDDPLLGSQLRYAGEFGGFRLAASVRYGEGFNDPGTRAGAATDTLENAMTAHADCNGPFLTWVRPPASDPGPTPGPTPGPPFSCTGTDTPYPGNPAEGIFSWSCTSGIQRIVITPPAGNDVIAYYSAAGNAICALGPTVACDVTGGPMAVELNLRFATAPMAGTQIVTDVFASDVISTRTLFDW